MIKIEYDTISRSIIAELVSKLSRSQLNRAMRQASRESTRGVKQLAMRKVPELFTIKSGEVRKNSRNLTKYDETGAEFETRGSRLSLIKFKHNPEGITRRDQKVTSEILRGKTESEYPSFVQRMRGNLGIYQRISRKRLPIRKIYGNSVPEMVKKTEIRESILKKMIEQYESSLERMIDQ